MEIIDCKHNVKCDFGACRSRATHEIKPDRVGLRGCIHVCDKCLAELHSAIGAVIVPRSVETAKKKTKKDR